MKQRLRFIINPISGVRRKNDIPTLIEKKLDKSKYDYDIAYTEYSKHAKQIAVDSAKEGVDIVCAVGGDGSVHEVGTALIGTKTKLAIIPTGSGNGLARHLKIPLTIEGAIELINNHQVIYMDTVIVNDKPFLGVGGYGFDALIAKRFNEEHVRGFSKYIKLVLKEYMKYKPTEVEFELDGVKRRENVVLCTVANASEFGNGFAVSPESSVLDGKIKIKIPKLTELNKTFRIKGKGLTDESMGMSGSLLITLNPLLPKDLNKEEENKLNELKTLPNFK